jgi:hypothetical protein
VPLEDLVEDDPVDEAAEADPSSRDGSRGGPVRSLIPSGFPRLGRSNLGYPAGGTSTISVTGPSLTSATPMQAPKTPFFAPSRSQKRS